ncbi:MAG: hypothetical protein MI919_01740 [Holophagales bacterium]|nr:hypothetical protein [Holophagales bacterium]
MNHLVFALFVSSSSLLAGIDLVAPRVSNEPVEIRRNDAALDVVDRLESLTPKQQLDLYMGAVPRASEQLAGGRQGFSVERLSRDPALRARFGSIKEAWLLEALPGTEVPSARELVEWKVMVSRNLAFRGVASSRETVLSEVQRIRQARQQHAETQLYADRTVVLAASSDTLRNGDRVFGRKPARYFLEHQARRFVFLQGERSARQSESRLLQSLLRTEPRLTFVFEGHGNTRALKLGGALTVKRLAKMLADRPADLPAPILIFDTCFAHDYARRMVGVLAQIDSGAKMPILIVPDEMGQSQVRDVYSAGFWRSGMTSGGESDLGRLLLSSARRLSVYVPSRDNLLRQIS